MATNDMDSPLQLLVVTTEGWEEKSGYLHLFEKANPEDNWVLIDVPIPVVVGKSGMAWGIGLHDLRDWAKINAAFSTERDALDAATDDEGIVFPISEETDAADGVSQPAESIAVIFAQCLINNQPLTKSEGDLRSPAGIFSLGHIFGFSPNSQISHLKMDYLELNEFTEAVDDPLSNSYNCIVDRREVILDWNSSEKMREEPLYELGLVIHHNFPQPKPGKGSAIFFHRWRNCNSGTAGCTAMSQVHLEKILYWLDKSKNPVLVQLPYPVYTQLQTTCKALFTWNLPPLSIEKFNLVNLSDINPHIILDIRYATSNNFLGFPVYPKPTCHLNREVAEALNHVQNELSLMQLGLKVFDGYRPLSVQQIMWDAIQDERYVSNPAKNKAGHTKGTAVDLTLVDCNGHELEMPTDFDDFTEKAHSDYPNVSEAVAHNRRLLREIMIKHGFQGISTEWWHFDFHQGALPPGPPPKGQRPSGHPLHKLRLAQPFEVRKLEDNSYQ